MSLKDKHVFMEVWRWIKEHIFEHVPMPEINVKDGAQKVVKAIDQLFIYWNTGFGTAIEVFISNEGVASIEKIKALIEDVRAKLASLETIEDIPDALDDFKFAEDEKLNQFIKDTIKQVVVMFSDNVISSGEAFQLIANFILYFKS